MIKMFLFLSSDKALLEEAGFWGPFAYPGTDEDKNDLAPLEPGDSYVLIGPHSGGKLAVRLNELVKALEIKDVAERRVAIIKEAFENRDLAKTVREYKNSPDKDHKRRYLLYQDTICGGPCDTFNDRLLKRYPPDKYRLEQLIEVINAVANRAAIVVENGDDFLHKQPFTRYTIYDGLPSFEFDFDYGPPRLPSDVIWFLQNSREMLKDGNVQQVLPIDGDNKAVQLIFNDGTTGRIKVSRLLETLPPSVQEGINNAMTRQRPHGLHRVHVDVSIDPLDIVGKSTGQGWQSCESLGGGYDEGIFDDIENINAIAIVRSAPVGKPLPEHWTSRVMLRWCKVQEHPSKEDIGVEPRFYGGNEKLNEAVLKELEKHLKGDGYLDYRLCVTPYQYGGYSDQAAASGCGQDKEIPYGPGAESYCIEETGTPPEAYDDYYSEYNEYGVCERQSPDDFTQWYYEGNLSNLLDENEGWDPAYSFKANTGCEIITRGTLAWDHYSAWSYLKNLMEDKVFWDDRIEELAATLGIAEAPNPHQYVLMREATEAPPDTPFLGPGRMYSLLPVISPSLEDIEDGYNKYGLDFDNIYPRNFAALVEVYEKANNCCQEAERFDKRDYAASVQGYRQMSKCLLQWRNDILALDSRSPEHGVEVVDIPPKYEDALKLFESLGEDRLGDICKKLDGNRKIIRDRYGNYTLGYKMLMDDHPLGFDHTIYVLHEEGEREPVYDSGLANGEYHPAMPGLFQGVRIPAEDSDKSCSLLKPLLHFCKLPLYPTTEYLPMILSEGMVPFEQWKDTATKDCAEVREKQSEWELEPGDVQ